MRATVLGAFDHQAVPFEAVVEAVGPVRSLRHEPVLQVMLVLQNQADAARGLELPGVAVAPFAAEQETAQFELLVDLTETAEGLAGALSYASALFERASAERLAGQFCRVLAGIAAEPETAVRALPLLRRRSGQRWSRASTPRRRTIRGARCWSCSRIRSCARRRRWRWSMASVRSSYRALAAASRRLGRLPDRAGGGSGDGGGGVRGALGGADRGHCSGCSRRAAATCRSTPSIRRSGWASCWPMRRRRWC